MARAPRRRFVAIVMRIQRSAIGFAASAGSRCNSARNLPSKQRFPRELGGTSDSLEEQDVDENRLEGSVRNVGGKVQEGVGRATGDTKSSVEGVMNQAAGTAQDLYGQGADVARQTASTFDTWLRNRIETQPYTTAIAALGIGWL